MGRALGVDEGVARAPRSQSRVRPSLRSSLRRQAAQRMAERGRHAHPSRDRRNGGGFSRHREREPRAARFTSSAASAASISCVRDGRPTRIGDNLSREDAKGGETGQCPLEQCLVPITNTPEGCPTCQYPMSRTTNPPVLDRAQGASPARRCSSAMASQDSEQELHALFTLPTTSEAPRDVAAPCVDGEKHHRAHLREDLSLRGGP